jgi:hypothetical protein
VGIAHLRYAPPESGLPDAVLLFAERNISPHIKAAGGQNEFTGNLIIDFKLVMAGFNPGPDFVYGGHAFAVWG